MKVEFFVCDKRKLKKMRFCHVWWSSLEFMELRSSSKISKNLEFLGLKMKRNNLNCSKINHYIHIKIKWEWKFFVNDFLFFILRLKFKTRIRVELRIKFIKKTNEDRAMAWPSMVIKISLFLIMIFFLLHFQSLFVVSL